MDTTVTMGWEILERMERAVLKVRERLLRATAALNAANVPYAVVGGNAVASWVATVDEGAVRNTRDVDLTIRRADLPAVTAALVGSGFVHASATDKTKFVDGPDGKPNQSVNFYFAGEKVRERDPLPAPDLETVDDPAGFRILDFPETVYMALTVHRLDDQVDVRDLIDVGLIDRTWLSEVPQALAERLQAILDTPED